MRNNAANRRREEVRFFACFILIGLAMIGVFIALELALLWNMGLWSMAL